VGRSAGRFGYLLPSTDPGSSTFGTVEQYQQNQARVAQLALKINL
jgi:hypothetical protein